jgi:hypothetical protein
MAVRPFAYGSKLLRLSGAGEILTPIAATLAFDIVVELAAVAAPVRLALTALLALTLLALPALLALTLLALAAPTVLLALTLLALLSLAALSALLALALLALLSGIAVLTTLAVHPAVVFPVFVHSGISVLPVLVVLELFAAWLVLVSHSVETSWILLPHENGNAGSGASFRGVSLG